MGMRCKLFGHKKKVISDVFGNWKYDKCKSCGKILAKSLHGYDLKYKEKDSIAVTFTYTDPEIKFDF